MKRLYDVTIFPAIIFFVLALSVAAFGVLKVQNQENNQTNTIETTERNNSGLETQNTEQIGLAQRGHFAPSFFGEVNPSTMIRRFREEIDRLFDNF